MDNTWVWIAIAFISGAISMFVIMAIANASNDKIYTENELKEAVHRARKENKK